MDVKGINTADISVKDVSVKPVVKSETKTDSLSKSFSTVLKNTAKQDTSKAADTKNNSTAVNNSSVKKDTPKTVDKKDTDNVKQKKTDSKKNVSDKNASKNKKVDKNTDNVEEKSEDIEEIKDAVDEIINLLSQLLNTGDIKQVSNNEVTNAVEENKIDISELVSGDKENSLKNLLISLIKNGSLGKEENKSPQTIMSDNSDIASLLRSDETGIMDTLIETISQSLDSNLKDADGVKSLQSVLEQFKDTLSEIKSLSKDENTKTKIDDIVAKISEKAEIIEGIKDKLSEKHENNLKVNTDTKTTSDVKNNTSDVKQEVASVQNTSSNSFSGEDASENLSDQSKESEVLNKLLDNKADDKLSSIANRLTGDFKQITQTVKTQETPTINRATINEDIIKSVKFMQNNSMKELIVKVNPGTLGEITIRMVAEGDTLKANIHTANKETYNLINSQEIKNVLNNENIKVTEVNISLYNEDTTFFRENGNFGGELSRQNNKHNNRNNENSNDINYSSEEDETDEDDRPGISRLNIFV